MLTLAKPGAVAVAAYIASIVAANAVTNTFGMLPIGFGLHATAGTLFVGGALLLRNSIQDTLGRGVVVAAIVAGALLSAALSPALAIASGVAFLLSELADMGVYTPLRRHGWGRAVLPASFVGAVADTVLFLTLAGFPVATNLLGQIGGKYVVTVAAVAGAQIWRRRKTAPAG